MSARKNWLAAIGFVTSVLWAAPVFSQNGGLGLVPGKATRADVERKFGKSLRQEGPAFFEYKSPDAAAKAFVAYREGSQIVERIEMIYPAGKERTVVLASLGLRGDPSLLQSNYLGKLEEFYAPAALVLTYRGGDATSNIHRVSYISRAAFEAAFARAGGSATPSASAGDLADEKRQRLNFDDLETGRLSPDAFSQAGLRLVEGEGTPGVYVSASNMVLPSGRSKVLLLAGARTTTLTFRFDAPIRRFSLTRIGAAGGASIPTWTLQAFDAADDIVDSSGEERGLPPEPRQFSVGTANIVRVVLSTDNRFGEGTWATWNSLPITEFEFER